MTFSCDSCNDQPVGLLAQELEGVIAVIDKVNAIATRDDSKTEINCKYVLPQREMQAEISLIP